MTQRYDPAPKEEEGAFGEPPVGVGADPSALRLPADNLVVATGWLANQSQACISAMAAIGPAGAAKSQEKTAFGAQRQQLRAASRPNTRIMCGRGISSSIGPATARTLKWFSLVDEYTRECLALEVNRRMTSQEVIEVLAELFAVRGAPKYIRSDNGPEFIAQAIRRWLERTEVGTSYIAPGAPWENGYAESFHSRLRNELLNMEVFASVSEAKRMAAAYRQEQRYARQRVELSRSTLCGWLAETAEVLAPLYALLKTRVLSAKVVHTDDTPIPVQDKNREHCRTGRIWAYVSTGGVVYDATADRCRDGPLQFLKDFRGYLQCDAYAGYDELFRGSQGAVVEVACWAHARRKFVEAEKTSLQLAHEAVARIRALYAVEHEAKDLDTLARAALRQQKACPLLDALKLWLDHEHNQAVPKTPIAEAIQYASNQWAALNVYVHDGDLAIDNNAAERAIKPFAIGRKNWMFFGSDRGGQTLATLASFTATCQLLKINPWTWLRDTLTNLPTMPAKQLIPLLPVAAD